MRNALVITILLSACFSEPGLVEASDESSSGFQSPDTTPVPQPWGQDGSTAATPGGGSQGGSDGTPGGAEEEGTSGGRGSSGGANSSSSGSSGESGEPVATEYGSCYDEEGSPICDGEQWGGSCILNLKQTASACAPDCLDACPEGGSCLDVLADQVIGPVCVLTCLTDDDCASGSCQQARGYTVAGEPLLACMWNAR